MQMLNQRKVNNKIVKKSHLLIIGSLLVFFGISVLLWNHLLVLKEAIYSEMMLLISDSISQKEEIIENIPEVEMLPGDDSSLSGGVEEKPPVVNLVPPVVNLDKNLVDL